MANLEASAVTINRSWLEHSPGGNRIALDVTIVLDSQGAATDGSRIVASAFGLTAIEECTALVDEDGIVYPAVPDFTHSYILIYDLTDATDGTRASPSAQIVSGGVRGVIKGY